MKYFNPVKFSLVAGVLFLAASTLRANDFVLYIEGQIGSYQIQGAPDLGIAAGDQFTGDFRYWDGHPNYNPDGSIRQDGSYTYDHFMATIQVDGITFRTTAGGGSIFGGDFLSGGGPAAILSPSVDYSLYFSTMFIDTARVGFFEPYRFRIDGSGGPTPLSPNGSSLRLSGTVDSVVYFDFATVPDPVRTDALLVLAVATLLIANSLCRQRTRSFFCT